MAKAITVMQPYARLLAMGVKKIGTRGFKTSYRGELYIHSSQRIMHGTLDMINTERYKKHLHVLRTPLVTGCIIGKATLFDIQKVETIIGSGLSDEEKEFGDYRAGRYGWFMKDAVLFDKPIPYSGALSIWSFNEALILPNELTFAAAIKN